ncbi:hypothetical protein Ahy_B04g071790 [Arachis hypogaea]|uniref:Uncharacterized protein n=1 Tax=Arachis hypogaea TaxID=3818 RepID=A0A444ZLK5_ARAHY|nr:hypothetical protein Ahy_B04g071790 [Arachis hypogaea]
MGEEARYPWQPPALPSPPPTPPSSDDSDAEPPPLLFYFMPPPELAIRTFFKFGRHHSHAEFAGTVIYLPWYFTHIRMDDATLRDLTEITKEAFPNLRENTKFSFARVFTDERGIRGIRRIGDYLDVSIRYPRRLMIEETGAFTKSFF